MKDIIKLFFTFFKIGAFTIGGGYAMVPVIQKEVVDNAKLITEDEFLDYIAVAQSIPGIIAVNVSTFIGYKLYGFIGAFFICFAVVLPSFVIIVLLANVIMLYRNSIYLIKIFSGVRPAVIGIMMFSVYKLFKPLKKTKFSFFIIILNIVFIIGLNIHPIISLIVSGIIGGVYGHIYVK
ncbi:chromate transporter [Clostridiaceae bacterium HSG29]|nr:chromate transporter [Clostridiaceae bacterium HSG29]